MALVEFEKDFGYLMPFLDKVAAAAGNLMDPLARAELAKLIAEEKVRWARVRQLLSGTPSDGTDDSVGPIAAGTQTALAKTQPSFTVGSLRPRTS